MSPLVKISGCEQEYIYIMITYPTFSGFEAEGKFSDCPWFNKTKGVFIVDNGVPSVM